MDTLPLVAPEQVGLSAQRLDRVRKWMNGWVDSGRLAGMVTAVMRRGELAFAETAGKADVERNKPMRPDTIFRASPTRASMPAAAAARSTACRPSARSPSATC
jgi:CubicO group peptidase (beta-lactamase class C family)